MAEKGLYFHAVARPVDPRLVPAITVFYIIAQDESRMFPADIRIHLNAERGRRDVRFRNEGTKDNITDGLCIKWTIRKQESQNCSAGKKENDSTLQFFSYVREKNSFIREDLPKTSRQKLYTIEIGWNTVPFPSRGADNNVWVVCCT